MNCEVCGQFGHVECRPAPPPEPPNEFVLFIKGMAGIPVILGICLVLGGGYLIARMAYPHVRLFQARPFAAIFVWMFFAFPLVMLLPVVAPLYAIGMLCYWPAVWLSRLFMPGDGLMRPSGDTEFGGDSDVYGGDQ